MASRHLLDAMQEEAAEKVNDAPALAIDLNCQKK
jgi:hypothetical protein